MSRYKLCHLLLSAYLILLQVWGNYSKDCTVVPISLSDLNFCSGSTCSFRQQIAVEIPVAPTSDICFTFISPDGSGTPTTFSLTVRDSHLIYNSDSMYFTDSPFVSTKVRCGCPGGSAADCPACNSLLPAGDTILCGQSTHHDLSCPADMFVPSLTGSVCAKVGLSGSKRFKIVKYKPAFSTYANFVVNVGNQTWSILYDGSPVEDSQAGQPFKINILGDSGLPILTPEFTVIDSANPQDFYLLDSSDVNSIDTFDSKKIGWYKTDKAQRVSTTLSSELVIQPVPYGCLTDLVKVLYPWVDPEIVLTNRKDKLSKRMSNYFVMNDNDYPHLVKSPKYEPIHVYKDYSYVQNGWQFMQNSGSPVNVGYTLVNGIETPTTTTPSSRTINCLFSDNVTRSFSDSNWIVQSFPMRDYDTPGAPLGNFEAYTRVDSNKFCICWTRPNGTTGSFLPTDCNGPTIHTLAFPENQPARHKIVNGVFTKEFTTAASFDNTTQLYVPLSKGLFTGTIVFNHLNITFDTASARPRINSHQTDNNTFVVFVAQSTTVGGVCYVYADPPDFIITQPINLAVTPSTFEVPINRLAMTGDVLIAVRCHLFNSTYKQYYDFNNIENQTSSNTTYINLNSTDGFNPGFWGNMFSNFFDGDGDFGTNGLVNGITAAHYIEMALTIIAIIAFAIILMVGLMKYYKIVAIRRKIKLMRESLKKTKTPQKRW